MRRGFLTPITLTGTAVVALFAAACGNKAPEPIAPLSAAVGDTPAAAAPSAGAPAAAPSAPEPFSLKPGEQLVPHKVAKGESLWVLAQKYNTRVSRIKSANNLTSDLISEGRTLQIPTTGAPAEPVAAPAPAATPAPTPAPAPGLLQPAPPVPAAPPAPAPAAPSAPQGAAPSLNFGTPAPAPAASAPAPAPGSIQIKDN